jgi:hypothetical protein
MRMTVHTLLEATISLYPTAADGSALLAYPIWIGAGAENLRLSDSVIEAETRETGSADPVVDILGRQHEIEIGRIWKLSPRSESFHFGKGAPVLAGQKFVLLIGWQDPRAPRGWVERTYYGATPRTDSRASEGVLQFTETQGFRAEAMQERTGTGTYTVGEPLAPSMMVRWVKGREQLNLFTYDAGTHTFTETVAGIATGRATLAVTPHFQAHIESTLAMEVTSSGVLNVGELVEVGAIAAVDSPRLEFWRGEVRMAILSKTGTLRVLEALEEAPSPGSDRFEFYTGSTLAATLEAGGLRAEEIEEGI